MKTSVSLLSVCHQARAILQTKYGLQGEEVREEHITELDERLKILRVRLTEKEKSRYLQNYFTLTLVLVSLIAAA